jgi:hypothetical protein
LPPKAPNSSPAHANPTPNVLQPAAASHQQNVLHPLSRTSAARDVASAKLNRTTTLSRLEKETSTRMQQSLQLQPHLQSWRPRQGLHLSKLLVLSSLLELAQPTLIVLLGAVVSSLGSVRAL